jgi:diaminohydroxyphosphoribosylaminopyrimidine deaminase/5-amino-6-(5-phosphoribosylamino)uracil reductase
VHVKWAMTLDGKLATRTGDSKWISSEESRRIVHDLRGRMEAIVVGIGTALADNPLLTARPPGRRTAIRIVLDSEARLSFDSQLVRTAREVPVLVAVAASADGERCEQLRSAGAEVLKLSGVDPMGRSGVPIDGLFAELGARRLTHVLVEGGAEVLGSCFDAGLVDEVHAFIAPIVAGGAEAHSPVAGEGIALMSHAARLQDVEVSHPGGDVYLHGFVPRDAKPQAATDAG